ncbi:MAG: hypothetical protein R3303_01020 [Marinobacter sp.]|nr:hypothetical protein [Marinobacter sp.]
MKRLSRHALLFSALLTTSALVSPLVHAAELHNGDRKADLCERLKNHDGQWNNEAHAARMQQWADKTADRLELSDHQRRIWDDIQQERQEQRQARAKIWREKMEKRCGNQ